MIILGDLQGLFKQINLHSTPIPHIVLIFIVREAKRERHELALASHSMNPH